MNFINIASFWSKEQKPPKFFFLRIVFNKQVMKLCIQKNSQIYIPNANLILVPKISYILFSSCYGGFMQWYNLFKISYYMIEFWILKMSVICEKARRSIFLIYFEHSLFKVIHVCMDKGISACMHIIIRSLL